MSSKYIQLLFLVLGILVFPHFSSAQGSFDQMSAEIDSLITEIGTTPDSRMITNTIPAKRIIAFGESSLAILAVLFSDTTSTNVRSDCQDRHLTKGEIAIIMADRIEGMPYATITGIQNCLLTFCENNSNLIEYYLSAIKGNGVEKFQRKYIEWLSSEERIDWKPLIDYKTQKERKKEIRKRRNQAKRGK